MKKSTAKRNFIALGVVAIIMLILAFVSFKIPFSSYTYNGFLGGMPLGYDLGEGLTATFTTSQNESMEGTYEDKLNSVVKEFNDFLGESFQEYTVNLNDNGIVVHIPNIGTASTVLALIDGAGSIEFKSENSDTAEAVITGADIESATYATNDGTPGVLIHFNDEGETLFYNLTTEQAGNQIYIYIGGELFFQPTVSEGISGGYTFISGNMTSEFEAQAYAFKITASMLGINLDLVDTVVVEQPTLGVQAGVYFAIIGAIILVATMTLFILRYKHLGLLGSLGVTFAFTLLLLILNLIETVQLTLASALGLLFAFGIMILNLVMYYERIYAEFKTGKKIPISIKIANKNAAFHVLDVNVPLFVFAALMAWLGQGALQSFATVFSIGILLSTFFALVVVRGLIKMYQFLNISNFKQYGFAKAEVPDEIK